MKYILNRRQVVSLFILLAMLVSLITVPAYAATEFTGYGVIFEAENNIVDTNQWKKGSSTVCSGRRAIPAELRSR